MSSQMRAADGVSNCVGEALVSSRDDLARHPQERSTIAFQQIVANAAHPLTFYLRMYGYLGASGEVEGSES
jgi:hypothetical protein